MLNIDHLADIEYPLL